MPLSRLAGAQGAAAVRTRTASSMAHARAWRPLCAVNGRAAGLERAPQSTARALACTERPSRALNTSARRPQATAAPDTPNTSLQITDPFLIYKSKVASGELEEDEEQLRAMIALRNLARKLQDYTPPAHLLGILSASSNPRHAASGSSSARADAAAAGASRPEDVRALTKWLSSQPSTGAELSAFLERAGIPRGLMLTGPPGTGKSMCMDIFYEALPVRYKVRRHYHHLLLEIYRIIWLEAEKRRKALRGGAPPTPLARSREEFEASSSGPEALFSRAPASEAPPDSSAIVGDVVSGAGAGGAARATVAPQYGTGVYWKRGGPDGKAQGWRRVLKGMPFFRPDALSEDSGAGGAMGTPEQADELARLANNPQGALAAMTSGSASGAHTTLALHAAAELFLRHGFVLLFDEVQLVDVASAGILRRVLEAYWRLGGVVLATSNRLPDDLYRNNVQREQLTAFLEVFKERCEGVEMKGKRDFRRVPGKGWERLLEQAERGAADATAKLEDEARARSQELAAYFVEQQASAFDAAAGKIIAGRQGAPSHVTVYGRRVPVPFSIPASEHGTSVARFTFSELCDSPLGPADYLTLASTYRSIILTDVPQLPLVLKNQARRLITFLDAAYEAGTELLISAAATPDNLFFPDAVRDAQHNPFELPALNHEPDDVVDMSARGAPSPFLSPKEGEHYPEEEHLEQQRRTRQQRQQRQQQQEELMSETLIQSETLSEAAQDTEEGFRPNIIAYDSRAPTASQREPGQMSRAQEKSFAAAATRGSDDPSSFASLSIFSGEDEKFAFQRAVSRIYEMSHPAWTKRKAWRPFVDSEMSIWKGAEPTGNTATASTASTTRLPTMAGAEDALRGPDFADEASYEGATFPGRHLPRDFRQGTQSAFEGGAEGESSSAEADSAFPSGPVGKRRGADGPPVISPVHVWGVREDWGPKAGAWGQGAKVFDRNAVDGTAGAHDGATAARPTRRRGRAASDAQQQSSS